MSNVSVAFHSEYVIVKHLVLRVALGQESSVTI